jgi:hypothetical protein
MGDAWEHIYSENGTEIGPIWHYLFICPTGDAF